MSPRFQAELSRGEFPPRMSEYKHALWQGEVPYFCENASDKRLQEYDQRVQDAIAAVPEGYWKEFAGFAGPGPEHIIGWDKVVLIGDASHPLHGMSLWKPGQHLLIT